MSRTKGAVGNTEWRDAVRKAAHELRENDEDGKPKKVKALEPHQVTQIACGGLHTASLTSDGLCLTWGLGTTLQLQYVMFFYVDIYIYRQGWTTWTRYTMKYVLHIYIISV